MRILILLMAGICYLNQATAGIFDSLSAFNASNRDAVRNQMQNFFELDPGQFYRSQQLTPAVLKAYLERYRIKTLVNLRGENEATWYYQEQAIAQQVGISFYSISMSAVVLSSKEDLQTLLEIYDTAPRPILVHCLGGADRTGEASALWVLEVQKKSKEEALKQLAITYGHRKYINSAKDFLIQIWGGREWLATTYRPDDYPWFCRPINE